MAEQKQRGDSEIDKLFVGDDAARDDFYHASEGRNLAETQKILRDQYQLDVALTTIGRWLTKIRRLKYDEKFFNVITELREDSERAQQIAKEVGDAKELTGASITMLAKALFSARLKGDEAGMKLAAKLLSTVLGAAAADKSATASVISAETQKMRFQFDAAKKAMQYSGELQEISKSSGSEQEKVERAVARLFGPKPKSEAAS